MATLIAFSSQQTLHLLSCALQAQVITPALGNWRQDVCLEITVLVPESPGFAFTHWISKGSNAKLNYASENTISKVCNNGILMLQEPLG